MSEISAFRRQRHNRCKTNDSLIDIVSCGTTREQKKTLFAKSKARPPQAAVPRSAMDQVMQFVEPSRQFVKDSIRLVKRCTKPDRKEFQKIAMATA